MRTADSALKHDLQPWLAWPGLSSSEVAKVAKAQEGRRLRAAVDTLQLALQAGAAACVKSMLHTGFYGAAPRYAACWDVPIRSRGVGSHGNPPQNRAAKVVSRCFRLSSLRRRHARQRAAGRAGRRAQWEGGNGCLYFVLGVVRIFSKFGAGCIFFQYLVTNYIFYGSSKGWLYFLVIFFEFLVFCHAFRANSVVFFSRARQSDQFFSKPPCAGDTHDLRRLRWR